MLGFPRIVAILICTIVTGAASSANAITTFRYEGAITLSSGSDLIDLDGATMVGLIDVTDTIVSTASGTSVFQTFYAASGAITFSNRGSSADTNISFVGNANTINVFNVTNNDFFDLNPNPVSGLSFGTGAPNLVLLNRVTARLPENFFPAVPASASVPNFAPGDPVFLSSSLIAVFNSDRSGFSTTYTVDLRSFSVAPVPVPAALPLFAGALGLTGLLGWRRRKAA